MKKTKKMMALVIAVVMMMAMTMTTMAADPDYKITIQNPVADQTYSAYKLFDVTYSGTNYSYTITDTVATNEWYDILSQDPFTSYFTFTATGGGKYNVTQKTPFDVKTLASKLNEVPSKPTADKQSEIIDGKTVIDVITAGYYFVDSSLGALCSLGTTNSEAKIYEKNAHPTIKKEVQEDNGLGWSQLATADIGQVVNYKLTVNVGKEFESGLGTGVDGNFVITDTLPTGLTVNESSIVISGWTVNDHYKVEVSDTNADGHKETIVITALASKVATLASEATFEVLYNVVVNEKVVVDGNNINKVVLTYGTYNTAETDTTQANVKTFDVSVFKYYLDGVTKTGLKEAVFTISKNNDGSSPISLIDLGSGKYRVAKTDEAGSVTTITTLDSGLFSIQGLDADTYYLTETNAPSGYNKLTAPVTVTIGEDGKVNTTDATIEIENQAGSLLPETGGIGTTIFYAAGALLVISGVVVLVTRKRMENQ